MTSASHLHTSLPRYRFNPTWITSEASVDRLKKLKQLETSNFLELTRTPNALGVNSEESPFEFRITPRQRLRSTAAMVSLSLSLSSSRCERLEQSLHPDRRGLRDPDGAAPGPALSNEIRPSPRRFYYPDHYIALRLHLRTLSSSEHGWGFDLVKRGETQTGLSKRVNEGQEREARRRRRRKKRETGGTVGRGFEMMERAGGREEGEKRENRKSIRRDGTGGGGLKDDVDGIWGAEEEVAFERLRSSSGRWR